MLNFITVCYLNCDIRNSSFTVIGSIAIRVAAATGKHYANALLICRPDYGDSTVILLRGALIFVTSPSEDSTAVSRGN